MIVYNEVGGDDMYYKIKEAASLAGVSVRTLHYYDEIKLLKPSSVSSSGYRLYTDKDLENLQQILFFRELGFNLQEIKEILGSTSFDKKEALVSHRKLLCEKKRRLEKIIETVDKTLKMIEGGSKMEKKEMFNAFDMAQIEEYKKKYAKEVREKYGNKVVDECENRVFKYTEKEWSEIAARSGEIFNSIAANMDKGPSANEVQKSVGELRQYFTDNFYNCTPEIFRGLGDLYVYDQRFTENIDKYKEGLAKFLREAMHIYCDNLEK